MAEIRDVDIRVAIANNIKQALTTLYASQDPPIVPRVHEHWVLSHNLGESASLLRAQEGRYEGKIHCWMVGTDSVLRERPDARDGFNTGSMQKVGAKRRDVTRTYRVWAYYTLSEGTLTNEVYDNTETLLIDEIDYVSDWFSKNPMLGFSLEDNKFRGHKELNFNTIDSFKFGESQARVAQGSLSVVTYRFLE